MVQLATPTATETTEETQAVIEIQGRASLSGEVRISGAKNSALAIMAGTILCSDNCQLTNLPALADIGKMCQILSAIGVKLQRDGDKLVVDAQDVGSEPAPYELVSQLRASFFVIGPLLARLGMTKVPLPGGCAIGARPCLLYTSPSPRD